MVMKSVGEAIANPRSAQPLTGQAEGEDIVYTTVERR